MKHGPFLFIHYSHRDPCAFMSGWFVTGTDTGVGKTRVACGLLAALAHAGYSVAGMKPVASGCRQTPKGLRSEDAEALLARSTVSLNYEEVNPYAFAPPVSPNLAARAAGRIIRLERIHAGFLRLQEQAEAVVVEGVGGWLAPLDDETTVADMAAMLDIPVILVVGLRLGCLNHTLLTITAIRHAGLELAGWVANCIDPGFLLPRENTVALKQRISAPLLGVVPCVPPGQDWSAEAFLDVSALVQ